MEIKNVIGSTLKKAPSQDYIDSFKLLIRGGFIKVSENNSLVLSTTAMKSLEKLITIISRKFENYQPMKIYSSNQIEIAFEYLNSEIQSYRQLPSKSRFINFKTNNKYYLKQGLLYPNISETLNFITITNSNLKENKDANKLFKTIQDIFNSLKIDVCQFQSFNPFDRFSFNSESYELAVLFENGKEQYVSCSNCNYYSRKEVATFHKEAKIDSELSIMSEIKTPGTNTIASLAEFLDVEESNCTKVVFYCYKVKNKSKIAVVIVRGDMEVSEFKIKKMLKTNEIEFATDAEINSINAVPGYASAIGIEKEKCTILVDDIIQKSTNLVAGANKMGFHLLDTNYGRDYQADFVGDIALIKENDNCKECQSKLAFDNGIPLFYSSLIENSNTIGFLDNKGKPQKTNIRISSFDITRMIGILSMTTDKYGVILPHELSPFQFVLITIGSNHNVLEISKNLYLKLNSKFDILFDNRDVKFGVKITDADLRSIPYRLVISPKTLENSEIEFLERGSQDRCYFHIDQVISEMEKILE